MNRLIIILTFIIFNVGCASADVTDLQKSKQISEEIQMDSNILDAKYVGLTKDEFVKEFGRPASVIVDDYPYPLEKNCVKSDCPHGTANELLTYDFMRRTEKGKTYYSIYAYVKDGMVVRIR